MRKFCQVMLSGFWSIVLSTAMYGQEVYVHGDTVELVYQMEEVVVYGEREANKLGTVTELKPQTIAAKNATTVAEVVKSSPGLIVSSGSKDSHEIKIRGFQSRDILVLVDGRPINTGYYGTVDLSMLPRDNIAKINIIKGPASVAYGANSMGGILDIITKNGLEHPQTQLEAKFGADQFRNVSLNHSRQQGRFNYWISASESYRQGYSLSRDFQPTQYEDGGQRDNSHYHKLGINGKLGFQRTSRELYVLSLGYNWARKGLPGSTLEGRYWRFPYWQRYSGTLSAHFKINPTTELKSTVFVDAYKDELIEYKDNTYSDDRIYWDSILENWTTGGSFDMRFRTNRVNSLWLGMRASRDLMNKKPDRNESWVSYQVYTVSLFSQDDYRPWPRTHLTVGLGFHLFRKDTLENIVSKLCPLASIRQELPQRALFRLSYSKGIRFPTLHHLFSNTSGNLNLKPEEADKYEIGVEKHFILGSKECYLSLESSLFLNEMKNMIYRESKSYRYKNIKSAQTRGIEVQTSWGISKYFQGELSYTYLDAQKESGDLLEEIPKHKANLMLHLKTSLGSEANYEVSYFGKRRTYKEGLFSPAYTVNHLNLSQAIVSQLKLRLEVSNIFDVDYEEELGYPQPGRQMFIGILIKW